MIYDTTYALGQLFQTFLQHNPDVLDQFCTVLSGEEPATPGMASELTRRLRAWIETSGCVMDDVHKTLLVHMAEAFVGFADPCDPAASASHF